MILLCWNDVSLGSRHPYGFSCRQGAGECGRVDAKETSPADFAHALGANSTLGKGAVDRDQKARDLEKGLEERNDAFHTRCRWVSLKKVGYFNPAPIRRSKPIWHNQMSAKASRNVRCSANDDAARAAGRTSVCTTL